MVRQPRFNILLVEDDYINALALQQQLERAALGCTHADSDLAFDEQVAHHTFDLVLMDINLGKRSVDGVELMKRLRQHPAMKQIPIFAVTGHSRYGDPDYLLREGFDKFISKPVNISSLLQLIQDTLEAEAGRTPSA